MTKLEIFMLGDFKVLIDGELIKENLSHKGLALLAYIVANNDKSFSRDKLSSLFWDSSNNDAARYNLRYTLWSLRKTLKDNKNKTKFILSYKNSCQINPKSDIYVDVFEMEKLIDDSNNQNRTIYINNLEKAKSIYRGEFLEGFYVKDCAEFSDWVFYERERLQREYFQGLLKLAAMYKAEKQYFKSIDAYEEMLKINPLQEELYVELIKIYLLLGHRKSALNQYERCCKVLRKELNISPSENIKEIYKEILKNNNQELIKSDIKEKEKSNEKIICISNSELINDNGDIIRGLDSSTLRIDCYPINDVPYYWVSNLVEEIIEYYDYKTLENISSFYWSDISRIQPSVCRFLKEEAKMDNLTIYTEKNRIFLSLSKLLNVVALDNKLTILIKNFQWIDDTSLDFIKYYFLKYSMENVKLIITCDEENSKVKDIEKLTKIK